MGTANDSRIALYLEMKEHHKRCPEAARLYTLRLDCHAIVHNRETDEFESLSDETIIGPGLEINAA